MRGISRGHELEKVAEKLLAVGCQHGFRVKLHSPHWMRLVAKRVNLRRVFHGGRHDLERFGQRRALHDEGVVAPNFEWRRQPGEQIAAIVSDATITFTGNTLGLDGGATSGAPGTTGSIGAFTSTNTGLQFGKIGRASCRERV